MSERRITIEEVLSASAQGTLQEIFGAGTAAVISPVGLIEHQEEQIIINGGKIGPLAQKLYDNITAIQYGDKEDSFGWCYML